MSLYSEKIEGLIDAALADGVLTEKEKQILLKKAQAEGIDLDEFEMVLDARVVEMKKTQPAAKDQKAPKSDKYGEVRKCPACGALVPALSASCPECGYEFSGVGASASAQRLSEQIAKIQSDASARINKLKQNSNESSIISAAISSAEKNEAIKDSANKEILSLIENFPLPTTKADIFDFLTFIKPKIEAKDDSLSNQEDKQRKKVYFTKYQECLEKAKVSFPNDERLAYFINDYPRLKKKVDWENSKLKDNLWIIIIVGVLFLLAIIGL